MSARDDDLRSLLRAHRPADEREAGFVARMLALLEHGDEAFDRDAFAPGHFTASAFVLHPDGAHLLLILHGKLGLWLQPGGHVEPGDATVLAAARREILEEVGLADVEVVPGLFDVDIHAIPASSKGPAHLHHDVRFLFRARTALVQAGDDARAVRWVALDEVERSGGDESVARALRRLRRERGGFVPG